MSYFDLQVTQEDLKKLLEGKINSVKCLIEDRPFIGDYAVVSDRLYRVVDVIWYGRVYVCVQLGFAGMYGDEKE